jgi:hypothetical protein
MEWSMNSGEPPLPPGPSSVHAPGTALARATHTAGLAGSGGMLATLVRKQHCAPVVPSTG